MRTFKFKITLFVILFSCYFIKGQTPIQISQTIFLHLKSKDYTKINSLFDTTGMAKITATVQQNNYKKELEALGKPKKLISIQEEEAGCKKRTALAIQFKKEKKLITILFDQKNKIESFTILPFTETPFYQLRGYKGFSEVTNLITEVKTKDGLILGADIAFGDTSKQKSPLVIFVHGSGSNDRDETYGPNKPFKDLAQGLAQQGIASLRYDKRTFTYQFDSKVINDSLTLYEETINDAIDAVNTAGLFTFIDPSEIYIIGHSQGAMCAPKIAELCAKIKGIVLMAAPARNIVDIIPEQMTYIEGLDDTISNLEQMQLTSVKWMVDKIKSPTLSNKTPKATLMGISANYWKSILNYNQVETAGKLNLPIFILNGERDYQVTPKEFEQWQIALKNSENVHFKLYPSLNHFFIEGEGKPNPKEYNIPGHIPQYVIDDLVKFIRKKQ